MKTKIKFKVKPGLLDEASHIPYSGLEEGDWFTSESREVVGVVAGGKLFYPFANSIQGPKFFGTPVGNISPTFKCYRIKRVLIQEMCRD